MWLDTICTALLAALLLLCAVYRKHSLLALLLVWERIFTTHTRTHTQKELIYHCPHAYPSLLQCHWQSWSTLMKALMSETSAAPVSTHTPQPITCFQRSCIAVILSVNPGFCCKHLIGQLILCMYSWPTMADVMAIRRTQWATMRLRERSTRRAVNGSFSVFPQQEAMSYPQRCSKDWTGQGLSGQELPETAFTKRRTDDKFAEGEWSEERISYLRGQQGRSSTQEQGCYS